MDIRRIEPADRAHLERFLAAIPDADRTFLKEDVRDPAVVEAWVRPGEARSVAVDDDGQIAGYVAVIPLHGWSSHVGELRLVVAPEVRGRGIGARLAAHALQAAVDLGLRKIVVEVVAVQDGTIAMFNALGFRGEAL